MAITAPRASTVTRTASTSVNCTVSGLSAVANELILIFAFTRYFSDEPSATPPTGYTLLHTASSTAQCRLYGKIAAGGDADATVSFTAANSTNNTVAVAVPGALANISTVKDVAADAKTYAVNQIYPSITPVTSGSAVIVFGAKIDMSWASVVPISTYTEILDSAASNVSVCIDYKLNAGALTGSTKAVTTDSTQVNYSIAISVKPALDANSYYYQLNQ